MQARSLTFRPFLGRVTRTLASLVARAALATRRALLAAARADPDLGVYAVITLVVMIIAAAGVLLLAAVIQEQLDALARLPLYRPT